MIKEKWIDEILQTAKQVKPVASNPYLARKIEAKLQKTRVIGNIPLRWVYVSSAAMLFLMALNITVWRNSNQSSDTSEVRQLIEEYGWAGTDVYSTNISNRLHE